MTSSAAAVPHLCSLSLGLQLFESSSDCVKLLSTGGNVLAMNRNGQAAMEIDAFPAVSGKHWTTFWPGEWHATVQQALADARDEGNASFSAACPTAKGTLKWWDVVLTLVNGVDGQPPTLLAVSRDITAARAAQHALQASEARLRSLVTATSAIVWNCPANGVFDSTQTAWSAFTGQGFDAYRDVGWLNAVHPDDRAKTIQAWERALQEKSICRVTHRVQDARGQYHHMDVKAAPVIGPDGAIIEWMGTHTDTTDAVEAAVERERLLKQVQAANDRMNDIFRQAPAFMCVLTGPDHRFEMTNDRYLQLVGNRDPIGQTVREALPEVEGQGFFELLDRVYQTGETFHGVDMPVMLQRHPGAALEERFIDLVYMALRNADGYITGLLAHGVDQTHRKLAELALYDSRERFEKIVSQAATGVVEMDIKGNIRFVNQKYSDMLGYSRNELIGRNVVDVTAPASLPQTLAAVSTLLDDGVGFTIDKYYLDKSGALVPATSSVNVLRGRGGEADGMVAIVLDTAASKQATAELRASEERYRTLFESMDQGFCIIDMLYDEQHVAIDYRFNEMNNMFEKHTGLCNAVGKTARELVPDLDAIWIDRYGEVARTGVAIRFESEASAMSRWFDVYATPIGNSGSQVAILFSDITARKAADETLRKLADDLAEADRRKTEFLATLAHELRNPLAPIRSGLSVIRLHGDNPATLLKVGEMMDRQVNHMVHLIDDLLDIARINGNKLALRKSRVDLKTVIASAVETTMPLMDAGRHTLFVDLPDMPLDVDIDATRIAQVVANLLNNAAKYTPAGGKIRLAVVLQDDELRIAVADNGVGIAPDVIDSVFDMFSQVGRNLDRAQGGLGIGLSLVRRLVEMHGGSVEAMSAGNDAGSTFTIHLPCQSLGMDRGAVAAAPAIPLPAATAQALEILVVDDNVDAADSLSMLLELLGHAAGVAHNGADALKVVASAPPSIVFLDIGMPGMNGYDTARAMRQVAGGADVTLVALTGWGSASDRAQSRDAGFDHHLTKPVQLADVQTLLATLADQTT